MIRRTIKNLEDFIGQVLSLNSAAILGSGTIGKVIVAYNEDGTLKVNDKNEVEIVGASINCWCISRFITFSWTNR